MVPASTKTKKRTGVSRREVLLIGCAFCGLSARAKAADVAARKKAREPYALITGTVFREPGFALRGAEVSVTPAGEGKPKKSKGFKALSDARGEFALRVPATAVRYTVRVKAAGFEPQEKSVSVNLDERIDVFFRLVPAK